MLNSSFSAIIFTTLLCTFSSVWANPLTPVNEPKDDSFYVCYEKRIPNEVSYGLFAKYTSFKYMGCIISRLPCHLYCEDKFNANRPPLKQFQWFNTYPKALNAFYRCAYSHQDYE